MHAAIIGRAALQAGGYKAPPLDAFMVRSPSRIADDEKLKSRGVMDMLKTMAVRKKREPKK